MINTDRTEGLRALIRQGLEAVSQKSTAAHLGDRSAVSSSKCNTQSLGIGVF